VLIFMGCAFLLGGSLLLSAILDKIYLCPRFNVNAAVSGLFLAAFLVWIGMWILLVAAGLL
jgi:hypothetical protein